MADEVEIVDRKPNIAIDSPDHANGKENPEEQIPGDSGNAESVPRDWKAWAEEETRILIQLYKNYLSKYPENYSKKLLFQEIAQDLQERGYFREPERIRNRMKSLRTAYRRIVEYNAKHILKKQFPYLDELSDLYSMIPAFNDENSSHSGHSMSIIKDDDNYSVASSNGSAKRMRPIKKSQSEMLTPSASSSTLKFTSLKRKVSSKKTIFPRFQCGQCYGKFSTSQELHSHDCQSPVESPQVNGTKQNSVQKKKSAPSTSSQNTKSSFQWTGMATLQFLTLLKGYQMKNRKSNYNGNLLRDLSTAMKKRKLLVVPEELKRKWRCLASNYEKTVNYNMKHQDQKKCAFYNRLVELYGLGVSLDMFDVQEAVKMTVEVSPFKVASEPQQANYNDSNHTQNGYYSTRKANFTKNEGASASNTSELVMWLDSFWKEWKELESKREEANAERHTELMEILACLAENTAK